MHLIEGNIRVMREELAKAGTPKDTDEIRESYDLNALRTSFTYLPVGETQRTHKHFVVKEATQVLLGEVEIYANGTWSTLKERQAVEFDLGEYHSMRAPPSRTDRISPFYPVSSLNLAALTITYKWIPPFLRVNEDEVWLLLNNDWFREDYDGKSQNPDASPLFRRGEDERRKFWEVVERNSQRIEGRTI